MKQFPTGILSIVSDTWDLWKVLTEYLPILKDEILKRDGKIVIRPDSGNPVDIICGEWPYGEDASEYTREEYYGDNIPPQAKGVVEILWDLFGGTINKQGYKVLDPHIGAIYGDAITLDRAEQICERLEEKGFASTNIVLGIGSFTYQYNTRDTFGFAMKATYVELQELIDNVGTHETAEIEITEREFSEDEGNLGEAPPVYQVIGREIFKDPVTDGGGKKSAKGLLFVGNQRSKTIRSQHEYYLVDQVTWEEENMGELQTIFEDGELKNEITLTEIRNRLSSLIN